MLDIFIWWLYNKVYFVMSENNSTFRIILMGVLILSGAINTIGKLYYYSKLISFKILNMSIKEDIIKNSFIHICRYSSINYRQLFYFLDNFWHCLYILPWRKKIQKDLKWECFKLSQKGWRQKWIDFC